MEYIGQLATQGVLGIVVVVEALVIKFLYDKKEEKERIISELQDKRVSDAQSTIKGIIDPLKGLTEAMDEQKTMFTTAFSMFGRGK